MVFVLCVAGSGGGTFADERSPQSVEAWRQAADLVRSADADLRAVGLERIRDGLRGDSFTRDAAEKILPEVSPAVQVALLSALAGRNDPTALPAVAALADQAADPAVRAAALRAAAALGGAAEVPLLVRGLAAANPVQAAARRGLVEVRGTDAVAAIVAAAKSGAPAARASLVDVLVERRERSAIPMFLAVAGDGDPAVRQAAVRALAKLGGPEELPGIVTAFIAAPGDDRRGLEQAILAVCGSNPGHERAADLLMARFTAVDDAGRDALLPVLARLGGPKVMGIVDGLVSDPARRRQGLEALARWPDATVADRLLDQFAKAADANEKALMLGALIRIAPLPDNKLNDAQKLELVRKTLALCTTDGDRARLIERASAIRTVETFRFVAPYLDQPPLAKAACKSVVELAHHRQLRDAHKEEFIAALDKVLATTQDAELVDRATRYKEGKTWERKQ